jgi:hypothetical protein
MSLCCEKVRQHWWPEYSWREFCWFNAGYFAVMIASVVLYDLRGGLWLILPLAWSIERAEQHSFLDAILLHRAVPS